MFIADAYGWGNGEKKGCITGIQEAMHMRTANIPITIQRNSGTNEKDLIKVQNKHS